MMSLCPLRSRARVLRFEMLDGRADGCRDGNDHEQGMIDYLLSNDSIESAENDDPAR
jgi:hypothetical protein